MAPWKMPFSFSLILSLSKDALSSCSGSYP